MVRLAMSSIKEQHTVSKKTSHLYLLINVWGVLLLSLTTVWGLGCFFVLVWFFWVCACFEINDELQSKK